MIQFRKRTINSIHINVHHMKKSSTLFTAIAMVLIIAGCKKNDGSLCIENRIEIFELEACESGATVKEYTFQNETVYALSLGNCIADGADEILDASCTNIGFVGGFGGASDINGENFYDNATLETTLWTN